MIKLISILVLILLGCQSGSQLDQPPTIRYGEDPCDECYMLINEARFAAAYVVKSGEARRFDDIGCLLIYYDKHQEDVNHFWITDFLSRNWIRAVSAVFVKSDSIQTPMGFGIISFKNEQNANKVLENYPGSIVKFPQLFQISEELYY
jgi:copper chaperone NosL